MKNIFNVLLVVIFITNSLAQSTLQGLIIDKNTSEIIIGAEIYIPALKIGTVSDINGKYTIKNIPRGKFKIQYSFLGYKNLIIDLSFDNLDINKHIELEQTMLQTEEVIISGGGYKSQHENAIKIETIGTQAIEQSSEISLIKNMAQIPGIDAISKGNGIATPVIRGLSTSNILMLTNGMRMENFQFSENHPFMIDEYGVDHIEFIKGPASLLYGSDAIGGVINIISEKPAPRNTIKADFSTKYNTNTQGINSNIGVRASKNKYIFGVRVGLSSNMDYFDGENQQVKNSRFNQNSIKSFIGYNTNKSISKIYYQHSNMKLGLTVPPAMKIITENSRINNIWYQNLTNDLIQSTNSLFFNKNITEINFSYQKNNRKLLTDNSKPFFTAVDMDLQTIQYELKNTFDINKNIDLIFAFQGMNQSNINGDAPEHVLPNFNMYDLSGFGLIQYKLGKFSSQVGIRYNYRDIDIPEVYVDVENTLKTNINNNYQNVSYSLGSTYELNENILLRANFASAFRSPNINELSQNGVHGTRYEKGNVNLKSQRNYELDLSTHIHFNKIAFNLAGFYNIINNYIYLMPSTDTTSSGMNIYKYSQDNSVIYGFETSLNYSPFKWLTINEGYSYLVGTKENEENLPFIPQNKIVGNISFNLPKAKFYKLLKLKITNEIAFAQNNYATIETYTPQYNVFNIGLYYSNFIGQYNFDITLGVNNIFNEKYFDHLSTIKGLGYYNIGRDFRFGFKFYF